MRPVLVEILLAFESADSLVHSNAAANKCEAAYFVYASLPRDGSEDPLESCNIEMPMGTRLYQKFNYHVCCLA